MKLCTTCKQTKPLAQFSKKKGTKDGLQYVCKECSKKHTKKWMAENPSFFLLRSYGITIEEKQEMMAKQNNSCAICKEPFVSTKHTHVDHCHNSTKIRGILCNRCNTALGSFKDSPKLLQRAIYYLEYHATENTTAPVSAGHYSKSEEHTKHGTIPTSGAWEDNYDAHHHRGAVYGQDSDHRTQEGSGDSLAHRNKKVEPSESPESEQDDWELHPTYGWIERRGGRLFD